MKQRVCVTIVVAACAGVAAATAGAAFVPAWSYLPARTPLFYRYRSGAKVTAGVLSVPFTNRVRIHEGLWKWTAQTFLWHVQRLPKATDCSSWRTNTKTLQLSGNRVYSTTTPASGSLAWRCVTDRTGRTLVLSSSTAIAGDQVGMGEVVASGLDVSRRTSG